MKIRARKREVVVCLVFLLHRESNRSRIRGNRKMDEVEFRRILDLFPIVRSRDFVVSIQLLSVFFYCLSYTENGLHSLSSKRNITTRKMKNLYLCLKYVSLALPGVWEKLTKLRLFIEICICIFMAESYSDSQIFGCAMFFHLLLEFISWMLLRLKYWAVICLVTYKVNFPSTMEVEQTLLFVLLRGFLC